MKTVDEQTCVYAFHQKLHYYIPNQIYILNTCNMNYIDTNLPDDLSDCFSGGAEFSTEIAITKNKQEIRNSNWNNTRFRYNLLYKKCNEHIYEKLQSFFLICNGRKIAFNFKDKNDYQIRNQVIGTGDGETKTFEIYKNYSYKELSFKRRIFKLQNTTVSINDTKIDRKYYTIDDGILRFADDKIPEAGDAIAIDTEYYVIVRFDSDYLPITRHRHDCIELPDISLVEVRV